MPRMLQFTPRKISALILACFIGLFGLNTFAFIAQKAFEKDPVLSQWGLDLEDNFNKKYAPFLSWLERTDYDAHLRLYRHGTPHPDIAVVEINERSIQRIGQFPFSRDIYGRLLERAEAAGAKSVGLDITFSERERNSVLEELQNVREFAASRGANPELLAHIESRAAALDNDIALVKDFANTKVPLVVSFSFAGRQGSQGAVMPSKNALSVLGGFTISSKQVNLNAFSYNFGDTFPIIPNSKLLNALKPPSTIGFFISDPDADSVIRTTPMVLNFNGGYYGSLSLLSVLQYLGLNPRDPMNENAAKVIGDNGYWIRDAGGKLNVPINDRGAINVGFYGKERVFPYYEFIDVLEGKHQADLKGKILFVGVTAVGHKDIRATPFSSDYPGVEVHATVASNLLQGRYLVKDWRYYTFGMLFLICGGLLISWCAFRFHPAQTFVFTLLAIGSLQFCSQSFGFNQGVVLPTLLPSLQFLVILFAGTLHRYFSQEKEKKYVRDALSRYVSGPVVEEILKDQTKLRLGGQKKELTVLFCDMVGFTKLSEGMDAQALTQRLNQFFTRMTAVILRNHGTLDKYMGDALMCFWGAPLDDPKHAEQACRAALEMVEELQAINAEWQEKFGFTVGIRIGINTGEMSVGNMGSDQVFSYTVMGDNVNLGSRLEGVNNVYGTTLLVSGSTKAAAGPGFLFRHLDKVKVKGKEEAVDIHELVSLAAPQPEWMRLFDLGLQHYRAAQWQEAEAALKACMAQKPGDMASKVFLERIAELKLAPPHAWDGVWKLNTK